MGAVGALGFLAQERHRLLAGGNRLSARADQRAAAVGQIGKTQIADGLPQEIERQPVVQGVDCQNIKFHGDRRQAGGRIGDVAAERLPVQIIPPA